MNVISTRVAFLSICIVVIMPFLSMFTYPETDYSMGDWAQLISVNVMDYHTASLATPQLANVTQILRLRLDRELNRFANFYKDYNYGPFAVCYGIKKQDDLFDCDIGWTRANLPFTSSFAEPTRQSMIRETSTAHFMTSYDLSTPQQMEAIASMGMICFIVVVMCVFGLLTSTSISTIALLPLERMLTVVRERCSEIFKYTTNWDMEEGEEAEDEDYDDMEKAEQSSEFALLEKVVKKLTTIAQISMIQDEPQVTDNLTKDEAMTLNWMQGAAFATARSSFTVVAPTADKDQADTPRDGEQFVPTAIKEVASEVQEMLETDHMDFFVEAGTLASDHKAIALYIIQTYEGCDSWVRSNVQETHLFKLIELVEAGYLSNPWHNWNHALDVLHQASRYMTIIEAHWFISEVSQFWVMVACIGHDLGHVGVNNQFLVETGHELALRYNDRSPLENMHCARLFELLACNPEANIFAAVEKDLYKEMRKGIIAAILHTDIVKHNEMIKELNILYTMNSEAFDALEPNAGFKEALQHHTQLILNMLLHGADMSNPMRPWNLCQKYARLCMEEFFQQGDQEKEKLIPVQVLNNRDTVNIPNSQIGFIEFLIAPMVEAMVNLFSPLDHLSENLAHNISNWSDMWIEESQPDHEATLKVQARVEKVQKRVKAVIHTERAKSLVKP
jgi:hypothetical protein